MTYHQSDGTITSSATEMPERIWLPPAHAEDASNADYGYGRIEYHRADAPLTPAEAMARCPEVAELVDLLNLTVPIAHALQEGAISDEWAWVFDDALKQQNAALAPFTTS